MLKHATICRTSKAKHWSRLQEQLQSEQQVAGGNTDEPDGVSTLFTAHSSLANNWPPSSDIIASSSCSASPTPSPHLVNRNSSTLSSAPSSVFSSPSKHYNKHDGSSCRNSTSTNTTVAKSADSTIKIFAQTLSQDVEYVTLQVDSQTKSKQIVRSLLRKFRLKHRDPNLFFLTLERWIRKDGLRVKSVMLLGDDACPLQLQQCCSNPPHNDIKFTLLVRAGALMKIYCSDVCPDTKYKSLSLSSQTTVDETIELMLHCLNLYSQNGTKSDGNNNNYERQTQTDQRQANSPGGNSSGSSSSSQSSSSSGIESDPTNQILGQITSLKQPNLISRAGSVTSISSSSNISNNSSSMTNDNGCIDLYCLVIECKDTNYKRVLDSDEYLVDVYQGLLDEARQGHSNETLKSNDRSMSSVSSFSVTNNSKSLNESNGSNISNELLMNQQPDQWFLIKLKRRDTISSNHLDLIRTTNPHKQLMPLPPIPQSLSLQLNNANELKHIVSTTQIEVNIRPGSGLTSTAASSASQCGSLLRNNNKWRNGFNFDLNEGAKHQTVQPQQRAFQTEATKANHLKAPFVEGQTATAITTMVSPATAHCSANKQGDFVCDDSRFHYGNVQQIRQHHRQMSAICSSNSQMPPPPSSLIWLPPVRPRKRNLSNASSTFQRPQTRSTNDSLKMTNSFIGNRRRYDPIQLAKDLSQLDLDASSPSQSLDGRQ